MKIFSKKNFSFLILILLLFPFNLLYNKGGYAQETAEEAEWVCEDRQKIDLPYITQKKILTENTLGVPVGKSTDMIEATAKEIIYRLYLIEEAATKEVAAAKRMRELIEECGAENCTPECEKKPIKTDVICGPMSINPEDCGDDCKIKKCPPWSPWPDEDCKICKVVTGYSCEVESCTGEVCPPGIDVELAEIQRQAEEIELNYNVIASFFNLRFLPITLCRIQYGIETKADLYNCIEVPGWLDSILQGLSGSLDQISKDVCHELCYVHPVDQCGKLCISPVDFYTTGTPHIEGYLDKSRKILIDCAVKPYEWTAYAAGETPGQLLLGCKEILYYQIPIHSYLGGDYLTSTLSYSKAEFSTACYGNDYCTVAKEGKLPAGFPSPPYPFPCAEDYFCCYSKMED